MNAPPTIGVAAVTGLPPLPVLPAIQAILQLLHVMNILSCPYRSTPNNPVPLIQPVTVAVPTIWTPASRDVRAWLGRMHFFPNVVASGQGASIPPVPLQPLSNAQGDYRLRLHLEYFINNDSRELHARRTLFTIVSPLAAIPWSLGRLAKKLTNAWQETRYRRFCVARLRNSRNPTWRGLNFGLGAFIALTPGRLATWQTQGFLWRRRMFSLIWDVNPAAMAEWWLSDMAISINVPAIYDPAHAGQIDTFGNLVQPMLQAWLRASFTDANEIAFHRIFTLPRAPYLIAGDLLLSVGAFRATLNDERVMHQTIVPTQ